MGALTEIVIFVASPGDCSEERSRVRSAAEKVTDALGTQFDVRIRVTGWEQRPPDVGRPQGQINPLIDACDVFIGVLNHRWGTSTGTHSSGFLEEFERALALRTAHGTAPKIALWLHKITQEYLDDPGEQLLKVLEFHRRVRDEHLALYEEYRGVDDFETRLVVYLMGVVAERTSADLRGDVGSAAANDTPRETLSDEELDSARREIAAASSGLAAVAENRDAGVEIDADRLFLIAAGLNKDPEVFLPVHIANRLYLRRASLHLSVMEHDVWLNTVLTDISSRRISARVIPGWLLLSPEDTTAFISELITRISSDDVAVTSGVLAVFQRLGVRPEALWNPASIEQSVVTWSTAVQTSPSAAIAYAASVARPSDRPLLESVADATAHEDIAALHDALGGDLRGLIDAVADTYSSADWKVDAMAAALPTLRPEELRTLVLGRHTAGGLRAQALVRLVDSNGVDADVLAAALNSSTMVDTVLEAVQSGSLAPDFVQEALANVKDEGTARSIRARIRAQTTTASELIAELEDDARPLDHLETWDSLSWSSDPAVVEVARRIFDTDSEELVAGFIELGAWKDDNSTVDFVRARARVSALRLLMAQPTPDPVDVDRLLTEIRRSNRLTREDPLRLLTQIAGTPHIDMLLDQRSNAYGETAELLLSSSLKLGGAATARRLLAESDIVTRRAAALALVQDPNVQLVELRQLLFDVDDEIRILAVAEFARQQSNEELSTLLDTYPGERDTYYYNVVVALDWHLFAASAFPMDASPTGIANDAG